MLLSGRMPYDKEMVCVACCNCNDVLLMGVGIAEAASEAEAAPQEVVISSVDDLLSFAASVNDGSAFGYCLIFLVYMQYAGLLSAYCATFFII